MAKHTRYKARRYANNKNSNSRKKSKPIAKIIITILSVLIIAIIALFLYLKFTNNEDLFSFLLPSPSPTATVAPTPTPEPSPEPTPAPTPTPEPVLPLDDPSRNLLTGLPTMSEEGIGKRPIAIMVNNASPSLPQYGLIDADVVFEVPVEGNVTRMMALYGDYTKVPDVCSVRSCRYYYPVLSESFDAIYVHWGKEANYASSALKRLDTDNLDGTYNTLKLFGRDQNRRSSGFALEHTSVFYGSKLVSALENSDFRTDISAEDDHAFFKFSHDELSVGTDMTQFQIHFGNYYSDFTYNADDKLYYKKHNGKNHIDAKTKAQLSYKNILVLETPVRQMGSNIIKEITVTGENKPGYYVSNGKMQKITWTKKTETDNISYFDENGEELELNFGKTYIAIVNPKSVEAFQ